MQLLIRFSAATLVAILVSSQAWAQYPGGAGTGRPGGGRGGGGQTSESREPSSMRGPGSAVDQLQLQIAELDEDLKLAPDQRKAWSVYVERIRRLAGDIARNQTAVRFPKGSADQQFDFLSDTMRNRLTAFEEVADAGKALYATLRSDQRDVADRRLTRIVVSLLDIGATSLAVSPAGGPYKK